jgi:hypothetical protein
MKDNKDDNSIEKVESKKSIYKAIGPLAGGIILDLADLATFGPIGLYVGVIAGSIITFYITSFYKLDKFSRTILIIMGGIYCTLPMTEAIPAATLLSAFIRCFSKEE